MNNGSRKFRTFLARKAEKYGGALRVISRGELTSKTCCCCEFKGG